MSIKSYSIRIDAELLEKLNYLSKQKGRSTSKQVLTLIQDAVTEFEQVHGTPITVRDEEK